MKTPTVKIDPDLLDRINRIISDKTKKIFYSSRKQFVNVAVLKLLEKEEDNSNG